MENNNCYSCYSCNTCDYCNTCISCYFCNTCYSCNTCDYCKNLKLTEYNYFCWSKEYGDENSSQQKRYRIFNVEVTKEEYEKVNKISHKLTFDTNESCETRYHTAFKKMWNTLTKEQKQEYYDIPHFSWEGFTFITGIEKEVI